jgi:hypothetical protein
LKKKPRIVRIGYKATIQLQLKQENPDIVTGDDSLYYKLTVDHAANVDNKPVTGSQWYGFWELTSSAPTATWASGTAYAKMKVLDISGASFLYGVKDRLSITSYAFSQVVGSQVDTSQGRVNFTITGSLTSALSPFKGTEGAAMVTVDGSYVELFTNDFELTWAVVNA